MTHKGSTSTAARDTAKATEQRRNKLTDLDPFQSQQDVDDVTVLIEKIKQKEADKKKDEAHG